MDVGAVFLIPYHRQIRIFNDILSLTRSVIRYGILYDMFSHQRATMQQPWRSLRSLGVHVFKHIYLKPEYLPRREASAADLNVATKSAVPTSV